MKILYLYRYGILGGVSTQLTNRLKYLKKFCQPHFVFLKDYGVRITFGNYPYVAILENLDAVVKYINKNKFDVIIVIDTNEAYKAIKMSNFNGVVINEVHTTTTNLKALNNLRENAPMDAIITPSKYLKKRISSEFKFDDIKPVYVVENCLDTELFKYQKIERKSNKKIILWVGKLDNHKNWKSFLSIAHSIKQMRQDCEFWLVGGYTAPNKVVNELLGKVNFFNLFNDFKWLPRVEYSDMPRLYSITTESGGLYINTSLNESFSMTIVESLACKCPVVAPNVGAIPEILNGKLSNYLYEANNENEAILKIFTLLDDLEKRNNLLKIGEKIVKGKYSIEKVGKKYFEILTQIIADNRQY